MEKYELSTSHSESADSAPAVPPIKTKHLTAQLWSLLVWCMWTIWSLLTLAVFIYIGFGILMLYSTKAKMEVIFSNRVRTPLFANLSDCRSFGLIKCEHMFLQGRAGKIGAWFISPSSKQYIIREAYILYLHGNMGSRALDHRVKIYQKLSKMGFHILAIDYRGFGDSEGYPTEQGLIEDSKIAYRWLLEKYPGYPYYIWGHSLGSAVGVQLAAWLNDEKTQLNGLILEAPFNNMTDAIKQTRLAVPVIPFVPNFDYYISDMKNVFRSSLWIKKVTSPVIILHDLSDHIIHVALGRRLLLSAKEVGTTNVKMVEFDEKLYHCYIYLARKLKQIVGNFVYNTS